MIPISRRAWVRIAPGAGLLIATLAGCSDMGKSPTNSLPVDGAPAVTALAPARTVIGDTVLVQGERFGSQQDTSSVLFTAAAGGTVAAATVLESWSDGSIRVLVPAGAASGSVVVRRSGQTGAGQDFTVAPRLISYGDDLVPLFQQKGCAGCHGGSGGLTLIPRTSLLAGGTHGPVVVPRHSGTSNIIRKLGPNPPFGDRMPQSGTPLSAAEIELIADWIDQGARADTPPPPPTPVLLDVIPARTVVGDTVLVVGTTFGASSEGSSVLFTANGGGTVAASIVEGTWLDTSVRVLVPSGAASGTIVVDRGGQRSQGKPFDLAPRLVSYADDLTPVFERQGCASCHGGQNNLFVTPYAQLMSGRSDHGPAVRPRRSATSLLVQVLGNSPPFGLPRMPQGSAALSAAQIRLITDWIDQGARNN